MVYDIVIAPEQAASNAITYDSVYQLKLNKQWEDGQLQKFCAGLRPIKICKHLSERKFGRTTHLRTANTVVNHLMMLGQSTAIPILRSPAMRGQQFPANRHTFRQ